MLPAKKMDHLDVAAVAILLLTVCSLPWMLGGAVPAGKLILVAGSCLTMILVIAAVVLQRRACSLPPAGTWLLLGISAIGMLHLLPFFPAAFEDMTHAVDFPGSVRGGDSGMADSPKAGSSWRTGRSVSPSLTRSHVAQWLALALLFCAAHDLLRTPGRIFAAFAATTFNACAITVVGLLQLFGGGKMIIGEEWQRYASKTSFGPFVNPNNAAGWLCVHLGVALGLLGLMWFAGSPSASAGFSEKRSWQNRFQDWWDRVLRRTSSLTPFHFLAMIAVGLILTGIAASLSRAGIVAGIAAVLIWGLCQSRGLRHPSVLAAAGVFVLLLAGFLVLFELDTLVLGELSTLKDPVSETTARLLHWSDSLGVVKDFPVLGAGQGTYRFCTLPYQRRWNQKWFVNADNQYVETIVESGILGLTLLLGFGFCSAKDSLNLPGMHAVRGVRGSFSETQARVLGATGIGVLLSQGLAMFFDFGVGLPSTAAALVAVLGAIAGVKSHLSAGWNRNEQRLPGLPVRVFGIGVRLCMVWSAGGFLYDLAAGHNLYAPIVQAERALEVPVNRERLLALPQIELELRKFLKHRPDDSDALRALMFLREAQARLSLADVLAETPVGDQDLQRMWEYLSPLGLADRILALQVQEPADRVATIRAAITKASVEYSWREELQVLQRAAPLTPGIRILSIASDVTSSGEAPNDKAIQGLLFAEPASARSLYFVGKFCFAAGDRERALRCWTRANAVSEVFRAPILSVAWNNWTHEECLKSLAPAGFEDTVAAAEQVSDLLLKSALWELADQQFQLLPRLPLTEHQRVQRARQLGNVRRDEALAWVNDCVVECPENMELRRLRAKLLEESGQVQEAIGEWFRIQHYCPDDLSVDASIRRLVDQ